MRITALLLVAALLLPAVNANAESDIIRKQGMDDVQTTMDRLESLVLEKGMTVFARIDHQANAKAAGLQIGDSQLLLFGNPDIGSRVQMHDIQAGLDLPLRVLVYKGEDGNTWISYRNPSALKRDYALDKCLKIADMERGLNAITDKALAGE